ncbi:SGNH/GDSL hydrolase family protein [Streptomyces sp. RS2]|uniref:SGNH/GDSL hydrolase family protein n=1 Tax=Streptomyces sp. RS2 TaxID=1451205 RepID=UPI0021F91123|nr:SGNH/GDSL hydrolase family protein [Streptomyces sp. RS2]MCW1100155.1 SGNH/GDSL hydrolase family protein [Streptomyces sp. RS2]
MQQLSRRMVIVSAAVTAAGVALGSSPASAAVPGESNGGVRVMPLGDSITDGYTPYPGGYRVRLWQLLSAANYTIDFVGSQSNGPAELGDHDHEGHPGWRIDQLDANINTWLSQSDPRTIMLLIGTNDLNQNYDIANAPRRLSGLIDRIRTAKPQSELFIATVPPQSNATLESRVRAYNAAIPSIVSQKGSRVHLVKMYEALTTSDLADGIHPTKAGYEKMAAVWYSALRSVPSSLAPIRTMRTVAAVNR